MHDLSAFGLVEPLLRDIDRICETGVIPPHMPYPVVKLIGLLARYGIGLFVVGGYRAND